MHLGGQFPGKLVIYSKFATLLKFVRYYFIKIMGKKEDPTSFVF